MLIISTKGQRVIWATVFFGRPVAAQHGAVLAPVKTALHLPSGDCSTLLPGPPSERRD
jgi:hypothetical protein